MSPYSYFWWRHQKSISVLQKKVEALWSTAPGILLFYLFFFIVNFLKDIHVGANAYSNRERFDKDFTRTTDIFFFSNWQVPLLLLYFIFWCMVFLNTTFFISSAETLHMLCMVMTRKLNDSNILREEITPQPKFQYKK